MATLTPSRVFQMEIISPTVGRLRYLADGKESNKEGEKKKETENV